MCSLINLYGFDPAQLSKWAASVLIIWTLLLLIHERYKINRLLRAICTLLALAALYGILLYTVLGRSPSTEHHVTLFAPYTNEIFREMFMNALLYFPLGLSLTVLIGPRSILAAFALSLGIETWQYCAGTGLAQGTDVIMNTLGCAIGTIPYLTVKFFNRK